MADEEGEDEAAMVMEVARTKSGVELFRELLRHYPAAEIEDYLKAGVWRNDKLKADIVLIDAHRREAGANDPLPLEEVIMPMLPYGGSPYGAISAAKCMPTLAAQQAALSSGAVELRALALFVAKWKLDNAAAKQMLVKLHPERRRQLITGFTTEHTNGGAEAMQDLEQYLKELDEAHPLPDAPAGFMKAPSQAVPLRTLPPAISSAVAAELRVITLFAAKFKLDLARTKAMLSSLTVNRRAEIIQTFTTPLEGPEATNKLEQFIKESEGNGSAEAGLKRPLSAIGTVENGDGKRVALVPPKLSN